MKTAILTGVLCVGMASAAYARDNGFSLPVPPGIPHQLVPGAKGSWLPLPPAPPLANWDSVRVPGGRVPVLVPDFDRHDHHEWRGSDREYWHGRGYGYIGVPVPPVIVPQPVVVAPPVCVPQPVVVAPSVVYAAPPVVYAPAPVVVAPPCGPRYYGTTSVGGYYSNGGFSIGFSIGR